MMSYPIKRVPDPQAILRAWTPFKELVGVTSVRTEADYARAGATIDVLIDEIGDNENHPVAEVLHYLGERIQKYKDEHVQIQEAEPREVLRLQREQHRLKHEDLPDCAPRSRISDILNGRRAISKEIAKRLGRRFRMHTDVFL
jgi:HTH-type transcriptional regulator/antitoxin HigA